MYVNIRCGHVVRNWPWNAKNIYFLGIAESEYFVCLFVTEKIQYYGGLRTRKLGQAPILLCVPNS